MISRILPASLRLLLVPALALLPALANSKTPTQSPKLLITTGWSIAPANAVSATGSILSSVQFQPKGWYKTTVPNTVMSALTYAKVYPDPYYGMNLRTVNGTTYPIGENFSNIPMPPESVFRNPWWYQVRFSVPTHYQGKHLQLHFDGLNYRANIWLNGHQIATSKDVAGAWRLFEFDVTDLVVPGETNALAIEIFPPTPTDLAITFVDWNPASPDKGMGIWRDVYLTASGPVSIRYPQILTKLNLPAVDRARLTVTAELNNLTDQPVQGSLTATIDGKVLSQPVTLSPRETRVVAFTPDMFSQLQISNPRLWWPTHLGPQNLYHLSMQFKTGGIVSDRAESSFGIREVTTDFSKQQSTFIESKGEHTQRNLIFKINGRRILIRGAGYTFDMLLRASPEREKTELDYVRDLNLNTVRLEGKIVDDNFLQLADEDGILIIAGWSCCDHWEHWDHWTAEDRIIAAKSLEDQIRRLRGHASAFDWMNGSDNPPPPDIEKMYISILKRLNWPNPYQSSATGIPTKVTGETGLKMTGPYAYVPPSYWLTDKTRGGAIGFNTETSPGAAIPPISSLRKMLPEDKLWPINSFWNYHAGGEPFNTLNVFSEALTRRYGRPSSLDDYERKAQVMAYENERAMFEAYGRNKYASTGVIQWMLSNAWPSMIWHLYDYYLRPGGGYFGTKKACEPLHIQYSYDDRSVVIVNSLYSAFSQMKATVEVYNIDMVKKYTRQVNVDVAADSATRILTIPDISGLSSTYFVHLVLENAAQKQVSSNFYWLSIKPDVLAWDKATWYDTPTASYSDLTTLNNLMPVSLQLTGKSIFADGRNTTRITVKNPSNNLAFIIHLKITKPDDDKDDPGDEILPVLWEDNYFSLLPGEEKEVSASYQVGQIGKRETIKVEGWNVHPDTITIPSQ